MSGDSSNSDKGLNLEEIERVITEVDKGYRLGTRFTFCHVCLGSNHPGLNNMNKGSWCCGSFVDGYAPPMGICSRFKLDEKKLSLRLVMIKPGPTDIKVTSVK